MLRLLRITEKDVQVLIESQFEDFTILTVEPIVHLSILFGFKQLIQPPVSRAFFSVPHFTSSNGAEAEQDGRF